MEEWIKLRGKKIMSSGIDVKPVLFEKDEINCILSHTLNLATEQSA